MNSWGRTGIYINPSWRFKSRNKSQKRKRLEKLCSTEVLLRCCDRYTLRFPLRDPSIYAYAYQENYEHWNNYWPWYMRVRLLDELDTRSMAQSFRCLYPKAKWSRRSPKFGKILILILKIKTKMTTLILFVSTFHTSNYCNNLAYTNPNRFVEMRCNPDELRWEFLNTKIK